MITKLLVAYRKSLETSETSEVPSALPVHWHRQGQLWNILPSLARKKRIELDHEMHQV